MGRLIPNLEIWFNRTYGEVDYYLTQALSGHGCFNKYLHSRRRAEKSNCNFCQKEDDAEHTLFECTQWTYIRETFRQETNQRFTVYSMREGLTLSKNSWKHVYKTVRKIIEIKEKSMPKNNL